MYNGVLKGMILSRANPMAGQRGLKACVPVIKKQRFEKMGWGYVPRMEWGALGGGTIPNVYF